MRLTTRLLAGTATALLCAGAVPAIAAPSSAAVAPSACGSRASWLQGTDYNATLKSPEGQPLAQGRGKVSTRNGVYHLNLATSQGQNVNASAADADPRSRPLDRWSAPDAGLEFVPEKRRYTCDTKGSLRSARGDVLSNGRKVATLEVNSART